MAELFVKIKKTISEHIRNLFKDGELELDIVQDQERAAQRLSESV